MFGLIKNGKICYMDVTTTIDTYGDTISPRKTEPMALKFELNKKIFYLPTNLHQTFPQLKFYYASDCSIKSVTKENFKSLAKLTMLNLSANKIKTFKVDTFDDLKSLELLSIGL